MSLPDNGCPEVLARARERQWMYLGPIAAAPLAHIAVSLYRGAKTARQKQLIWGVGVAGTTVATLGMRLYLMAHAGYAGGENKHASNREKLVTLEEKKRMEKPSVGSIAREAFRGFA